MEEEIIFTFSDVKRLFLKNRKAIFRFAVFCFVSTFIFFLISSPPLYLAKATFNEKNSQEMVNSKLEILNGIFEKDHGSQALHLMRSLSVMRQMISTLGLQLEVRDKGKLFRLGERVGNNFRAILGLALKEKDKFEFSRVSYDGEIDLFYFLRFRNSVDFELLDVKENLVATGKRSEPLIAANFSFTLAKAPKSLKLNKTYPLVVKVWRPIAEQLIKEVEVKSQKNCKSQINLSFVHPDKNLASSVLDEIMESYNTLMRKENDLYLTDQIEYLSKRKAEMNTRLVKTLDEYVDYYHGSLRNKGCLGHKHRKDVALDQYKTLSKKLFSTELQLKRLDSVMQGTLCEPYMLPYESLSVVGEKILALQQERDSLNYTLNQEGKRDLATKLNQPFLELGILRNDIAALENFMKKVLEDKLEIEKEDLSFDRDGMIKSWIVKIKGNLSQKNEKKDFSSFLSDYLHFLKLKERALKASLGNGSASEDYDALNLDELRPMFSDCAKTLGEAESEAVKLDFAAKQVKSSDFNFGSLSTILKDDNSQKMISKASNLLLMLNDKQSVGPKEKKRLRRELKRERIFFSDKLKNMAHLNSLERSLLQKRLKTLQDIILKRIGETISLLKAHAESLALGLRSKYEFEKDFLKKELSTIDSGLSDLPEMWRMEKLLAFKIQLDLAAMQSLAVLMENKTLGVHLNAVRIRPWDSALASINPINATKKIIHPLFWGLLGGVFFFVLLFFRGLYKGFPVSQTNLSVLGKCCFGQLSFSCQGIGVDNFEWKDLKTLRKMQLFIDKASVISLFLSQGPDYSHSLASLLAKRGKKVLLISAFCQGIEKELKPGLLQLLEKKVVKEEKVEGYFFLPSGGRSSFGAELMFSESFMELLADFRKKYDVILIGSDYSTSSIEAEFCMKFSDKIIVTLTEEPLLLLKSIFHWDTDSSKSGFVFNANF